MKELSLHVLDIAQNSVKAGAQHLSIAIEADGAMLAITITDDGCGMDEAFLATVVDPFTTTRTTRKVGMGLPLYKLAAEQAGGRFSISSRQGEGHGTSVCATFDTGNIDCPPLGDMNGTVLTLIQGSPELSLDYRFGEKHLSTDEMREVLEGVPLNDPAVLAWANEYLSE